MSFEQLRFWVGLLMALDALFFLLTHTYWERKLPGIRLRMLATLEAVAALIILGLHLANV